MISITAASVPTGARLLGTSFFLTALFALSCATGLTLPAHAEERGFHQHEARGQEARGQEARDHEFREQEFHDQRFLDSRYNHGHYYPPVGYQFRALPPSSFVAVYGGSRFYFSAGVWYRPFGGGFLVAGPPFGIVIPVLPPYYTQLWLGGIPYYYANNVYYMQRPDGYVVVQPPQGTVVMAPPPAAAGVTELGPANGPAVIAAPPVAGQAVAQAPATALYVYPRQGQSIEQQKKDRSECDAWAAGQASPANSADYQRALSACMDGRGYTVK
jgi:Family of unknown function (DUF6515)